jgi:2-dehydropantoate 2-reductase
VRYIIYGAGGIGGVIGARLFQAGFDTTLIARGEHARVVREQGLRLVSPQGIELLPIPTVLHPRELTFSDDTVVLMCMKSQHSQAALEDLAAVAPMTTAVACVQNGVANEPLALRYFANVYATVVILPAMFLNAGEVATHAEGHGGILDTGCYPSGLDETARQINEDLSVAGFSAKADAHAMRQKYAKLLSNLANVMAAGLRDFSDAGDLLRLLRSEALACYAAAGIDCATKDETKARREGVMHTVDIPGYERSAGSSWQSMVRGTGDIETDYLNGEICWLGRRHNIATPTNDACVELARQLVRVNTGPGLLTSQDLRDRIEKANV